MKFFTKRLGVALVAFAACYAFAGTVTTKRGQGFTGLVQFADAEHLIVGPARGPRKIIALADVLTATFDPPLNPDLLAQGAPMAGKGCGLLAKYYNNPRNSGDGYYRLSETIDHRWGKGVKPMAKLNPNNFSIDWSGELEAPVTGEYTFMVLANNWGQLEVGELKLGGGLAAPIRGTVMLQSGKRYPLQFKFHNKIDVARAQVRWKGPGFESGPIPFNQLFPVAEAKLAPYGLAGKNGLLGAYYENQFFSGNPLLVINKKINFTRISPGKEYLEKNFSVRWTGQLEVPQTEEYTFKVETDGDISLYVGGEEVVDKDDNFERNVFKGAIPLKSGVRYNVRIETKTGIGSGFLKVKWAGKSMQEKVFGGKELYPAFQPPLPKELGGDEVEEPQMLGVFSWGGSRVAAVVATADDSAVRFEEGSLPMRISTVNVARIVLKPVPERFRARLMAQRKGVLLTNGDFIEGELQELKTDWLTINSVLFGIKVYGRGEVIALVLGKIADKPVRSAKYEVRLENGSLLFARRFKLEKGSVVVDDPTVGKVSIPLAELEELRAVKR